MATNLDYERRKAVANAWKAEKQHVLNGKGTRDWTQQEQRAIIAKGKAKGYEGHHMKSVDGHNSRAGDANNIQFLNRKEHLAAHSGDFHNNTNGFYDHTTGEMHSFGRNKPTIESKPLSKPLSDKKVENASKEAAKLKEIEKAKAQARSLEKRNINKTVKGGETNSKTLDKQRRGEVAKDKSSLTKSKTLSQQRKGNSTSSTISKGNKIGHSH